MPRERALLAWYRRVRRPLPWRATRDPYALLVSEVMLQQTQAARVVPYYEAFLARFPDAAALAAAPTRVVVAAGTESRGTITWRTSEALAGLLGRPLAVFPSHHGGFLGGEHGYAGQPEAFAARLREVLGEG